MAHTQQTVENQDAQFVQTTHLKNTDYNCIVGGAASTIMMISHFCIVNNDAGSSQTVIIKKQKNIGTYVTVFSQTYTVAADTSLYPAEFFGQTLTGAATKPDKITIQFSVDLGAGDTIDSSCTCVTFS